MHRTGAGRRSSLGSVVALVLLVSCTACGGDDDSSLAPPTSLAVSLGSYDPLLLRISWTPPAGEFDGYELQGRVGADEWETFPDLVPADAIGGWLEIDPSVPEATTLSFRIRTMRGASRSDWSAVASVVTPVRAATGLAIAGQPGVALRVTWTKNSRDADAVRLERRPISLAGEPLSAWEARPGVGLADTAYDETDLSPWTDGSALAYRVVYAVGAVESAPAEATSGHTLPLAPGAAAARVDPEGVQVSWENRSASADHVAIERFSYLGQPKDLGVVAVPTASVLDAVVDPGLYRYKLRSVFGTGTHISNFVSEPVYVDVVVPPPGSTLGPEVVHLPGGDRAARAPDGSFAVACGDAGNFTVAAFSPGAAVRFDSPERVALAKPGVLVDPAGRPHVVFIEQPEAWLTPMPVHHAWFDGTWHDEVVAEPSPSTSAWNVPLSAAVDGAGALHLLWSATGTATYATNAGGDWATEAVSTAATGALSGDRIAVTASGTPVFVGGNASGVYLVHRNEDGWTADAIPDGTLPLGTSAFLSPATDRALVFYEQAYQVMLVERTADGWQAPVTVADLPFTGLPNRHAAALSEDGTRVAVATNGQPGHLRIRSEGAWGDPLPLAPSGFGVATGFRPDGKAWALVGLAGTCGAEWAYVLYQEP